MDGTTAEADSSQKTAGFFLQPGSERCPLAFVAMLWRGGGGAYPLPEKLSGTTADVIILFWSPPGSHLSV